MWKASARWCAPAWRTVVHGTLSDELTQRVADGVQTLDGLLLLQASPLLQRATTTDLELRWYAPAWQGEAVPQEHLDRMALFDTVMTQDLANIPFSEEGMAMVIAFTPESSLPTLPPSAMGG